MHLKLADARALAVAALKSLKFDDQMAAITADHLVDAGSRGVIFGSLPRILAIAEKLRDEGDRRRPIKTIRETPLSALLDGGDHVGYVVAHHATQLAVEKAKQSGIAIVGANNTYYTGLFSYYMEMATRENLVAMAIGNGPAVVAPEGAIEPRLGTNPISFGFPTTEDPVIWDIGTSAIMHGEVLLHRRLGERLPQGVAIDKTGAPTVDPTTALQGAIKAWGGHRGSGLSIVVQMLGVMCDGPVITPGMREMAYLVLVVDPKLLMPLGSFPERAGALADAIRGARPTDPNKPVRMPFDRSAQKRRQAKRDDKLEVPDEVHKKLVEMAEN